MGDSDLSGESTAVILIMVFVRLASKNRQEGIWGLEILSQFEQIEKIAQNFSQKLPLLARD